MSKLLDVVMIRGRIVKGGEYEIRIYVYSEYKKLLEKYVGKEVEGILVIREK